MSVTVQRSRIASAGDGLFACVPFRKGDAICQYAGRLLRAADLPADRTYVVQVNGDHFIDGAQDGGVARYANDAGATHNNARLAVDRVRKRVILRATRNIAAGSEIYVSYGKGYWAARPHVKRRLTIKD